MPTTIHSKESVSKAIFALENLPVKDKLKNLTPQTTFYCKIDPREYFRAVTYDPSLKILGVAKNYKGFMFFYQCSPEEFSVWNALDSESQTLQLYDMMPLGRRWTYHYYAEMTGNELFPKKPKKPKKHLHKTRHYAKLK